MRGERGGGAGCKQPNSFVTLKDAWMVRMKWIGVRLSAARTFLRFVHLKDAIIQRDSSGFFFTCDLVPSVYNESTMLVVRTSHRAVFCKCLWFVRLALDAIMLHHQRCVFDVLFFSRVGVGGRQGKLELCGILHRSSLFSAVSICKW